MNFNRIASFPVFKNMTEGADTNRETSPEIIAATAYGMTLVYTLPAISTKISLPDGAVGLDGIDATDERGALIFTQSQPGRQRQPDAVKQIDDNHFATANEGDYQGCSRGWTIFHKDWAVVYQNGTDPASPVLKQLLPSGFGPEGYVVIPERNLLISANENDLIEDGGPRAHVSIFEHQDAPAAYPHLTSEGADELIGQGAPSGLVADEDGMIYAANDSFYGLQPSIFQIDPSPQPARIVDVIRIHRQDGNPAQKLDLEGITPDGQ